MGTHRLKLLVPAVVVAAILVPATLAAATFVSPLYHYTLQVPAGFHTHPAKIPVAPGFYPSSPGPGTDEFISGGNVIGIAATQLTHPISTAAWATSRREVIGKSYKCYHPKSHTTTLAGAPAVELEYVNCYGGSFDAIEAVHGDLGYDVYWLGAREQYLKA